MRLIFRIVLILLILAVLAFFAAMDRVDYTPYFVSDYYTSTIDELDRQIQSVSLSFGKISIGLGKTNITPLPEERPVPMAGYGQREGAPAEGVHDSLYIKTLALQVGPQIAVLVSADLLIIPPNIAAEVTKRLEAEGRVSRDQLLYSATHTHSSLGGWSSKYVGKAFAGEPNPWALEWLCTKMVDAVNEALDDLRPGRIGYGRFEAPQLVKNRLVGDLGREHDTCSFLTAQQDSGRSALLGVFAAHATTLSDRNMAYSADYPAYWYQKLEAAGIDLPIFCAGSVGSHGPEAPGKDFEQSRFLGEALADSLLQYAGQVQWRDSVSFAILNLPVDLPVQQVRLSEHWYLSPYLSSRLFPARGEVRLQSLRINEFLWTTTPSDFSGELALVHQNALAREGYQSVITSFNGAYIGYVLPTRYYHLNEYESRTMSWFGPYAGDYFSELILRMTQHLSELQ